jgi:hypothetical protein
MAANIVMLIHTHFHAATGWHIFRLSPLALRHSLSTALPLLNTCYTRTILQLMVIVKRFLQSIWKKFLIAEPHLICMDKSLKSCHFSTLFIIVKIVIILEHFQNILWTNPKPSDIITSILQNFIGSVI